MTVNAYLEYIQMEQLNATGAGGDGCRGEELNLHALRHTLLKRARLPFRHPGYTIKYTILYETFSGPRQPGKNICKKPAQRGIYVFGHYVQRVESGEQVLW